jgi:STE24 endopeptidase
VNEDRSTRYQRLKRRAGILSFVWSAALLTGILWTGLSHWLRTGFDALAVSLVPTAVTAWCSVALYAACLVLLHEIGGLPISYYGGFLIERRYGLSSQQLSLWLLDQAKSITLSTVMGTLAACVTYAFIWGTPEYWWLPAGVTFALLIVGLANLAPVLLLPLFYEVKPLNRESLRARLLVLAERAGTSVLGAYQWGLSAKTKKANAALTGLGSTRRILVSDTMLAEYPDEEIEIVLAHELAHHVHGDIWRGLALEGALIVTGFFLAARVLETSVGPLGLSGAADVAGLPVLVLVLGGVSLLTLPIVHAVSRSHERRADRLALRLTRNPGAFVSAMRRLAAQNLAEERPSRLVEWLFYSHPPIRDRIRAAEAFKA